MTNGTAQKRAAPAEAMPDDPCLETERLSRLIGEQAETIAHFRKMYERASALAKIGVWECDLATEALTWTDGVYDLFEIPRGAPLERARIVELYEEDSRREMERLRAAAIREGLGFTLDIRVRTAKGHPRWLRLTVDIEREGGRPVRIFGTKQDISEEKAAEEKVRALQAELIQASRRSAMGAMASTLAHELNQPLAAIGNFVAGARRMLDRPEPDKPMLERGLASIEQCAQRAANIIRSLRAMSGDDARRERIGVNGLVREAASLALPAGGGEVTLRLELGEDAAVSVDPVQIQQVFIALVKNAAEAARPIAAGEIVISSIAGDGAVVVSVEDNGPGLPTEAMKTLFDSRASAKRHGMGIGLPVSRTIVEAHGGKIAAANRDSGGASFRVTLPLATDDDDGH